MSDAASAKSASNAALVERVRAGDASAFEMLFRAHHAPLCAFAYRFVQAPDVAEEIVQEVFLFVWERRETWDVRESVKTYLFTAVRNAAVSYLRHERVVLRHQVEMAPLIPQTDDSTDERVRFGELAIVVRDAVRKLPERCQLVFRMHREQGLTYGEIAKVLELSPKTVEVQMGRALKVLRKALEAFRT